MSFEAARTQMIQQQLRAWHVLDLGVLEIFARLSRESFVPTAYRELAYADTEIPLGRGNRMLAPKIAGRIVQAVRPRAGERVLDIGTGTGYLTAALAADAAEVRSLEIRGDLAAHATQALAASGVRNAQVEHRDAYAAEALGSGTYDVIVLTASLPQPDERFERHLAVGGRMFVVIGAAPVMTAFLIERIDDRQCRRTELFDTVLEPLRGADAPERFHF